jgi:hypothetical protein
VGEEPLQRQSKKRGPIYLYLVEESGGDTRCHRLNMELDLQSLSGLMCTAVLIG